MFKKIFSFILNKQLKSNFNFYINIFTFIKNKNIFSYYKNNITFYINTFNSIKIKLIAFKELNIINISYIISFNKFFFIILLLDIIYFLFIKI